VPDQDGQSDGRVWALEKDEFWVVLPNNTECTFTCGTKPPHTHSVL
jgi:hypothetical protein